MNHTLSEDHANPDVNSLRDRMATASHPARGSTPIKPKSHTERLFSTYSRFRHPLLMSIGRDLGKSMVGPMPVQQFLDAFLPIPHISGHRRSSCQFKKGTFQTTIDATDKLKMYGPFIESMGQFAPQLVLLDTHCRGDAENGYTFQTKPDISVYHRSLGDNVPTGCDSSLIDMHVEFKLYDWDDPFICPPRDCHDTAFISTKPNETNTLGQIGAYAAAQLASQFRTHCFSMYIIHDAARIIWWERDGAIITEPIYYNTDSALVRFFSRFSQAPPELCGINTTISPAPVHEAELARCKLSLPEGTAMFQTTVPRAEGGSGLRIVFACPDMNATTPFCCGTRACPAYDPTGDCVVFFKDSWHVNADDIFPEGEIYAKLAAKKVLHVPHCLASSDVEHFPEQKPQVQKYSQYPWACQKGLEITSHIHYCLILDLVGETLMNFRSSRELVQAIHDALVAHQAACAAGYLHWDLSPGNIILVDGCGYLINWDFAKATTTEVARRMTCTGTWPFMSTNLVEDPQATHTFQDDLESSFWLLLWMALMYTPSSESIGPLSLFIRQTFESEGQQKRSVLLSQTILNHNAYLPNNPEPPLFPNRRSLYLLLGDLADLFRTRYWIPELVDWQALETVETTENVVHGLKEKLSAYRYQQCQQRLQDHRYTIECFSHHLEGSDWPENDKAVPQELTQKDSWEMDGPKKVTLLQSKHVLELLDAEEQRQLKPKKAQRSWSSRPKNTCRTQSSHR